MALPRFVDYTGPSDRTFGDMVVFPIIKALYFGNGEEVHKLVGTGFFIDSRRFLTARHVFEGRQSAFDLEGASGFALYCVYTINLQRYPVARYIDVASVVMHSHTDVATGLVEVRQFGRADPAVPEAALIDTGFVNRITADALAVGTRVFTIAYPRATVKLAASNHVHVHSQSDAFEGRITKHYPAGRDTSLLSWPCYETDMEIMGGASVGPVFVTGSGGVVFGINCTGTEPHCVSHVTSLAPLARPSVGQDVIRLPTDKY